MDIPQEVIDELILTLHQSQHPSIFLGGTSGRHGVEVAHHTHLVQHRHQTQAISAVIGSVLKFASPHVQHRVGSTYQPHSSQS